MKTHFLAGAYYVWLPPLSKSCCHLFVVTNLRLRWAVGGISSLVLSAKFQMVSEQLGYILFLLIPFIKTLLQCI